MGDAKKVSKRDVCPIFDLNTDWSSNFVYSALREASKIIKTHYDNYFAFRDFGRNILGYCLTNPNQILVELTWQNKHKIQQMNITMSNGNDSGFFYNRALNPFDNAICALGLMFLEKILKEEKIYIHMEESVDDLLDQSARFGSTVTMALSVSHSA
jgi:hypothetical protein